MVLLLSLVGGLFRTMSAPINEAREFQLLSGGEEESRRQPPVNYFYNVLRAEPTTHNCVVLFRTNKRPIP